MAEVGEQQDPVFLLEVVGQELSGSQFEVAADGLLVGRSPSCDVVFQSPAVSRRHAYFYPNEEFCWVKDLGSKNGMLVNGRRAKETRLTDGDEVDIGPSQFILRTEGVVERRGGRLGLADEPDFRGPGSEVLAVPGRFLAVSSLVFGLLAYLHWFLGVGAVMLAALGMREMRRWGDRTGMGFAVGGLAVGLMGVALNAWFLGAAPRLRERGEQAARAACRENLARIAAALHSYSKEHAGAYPEALEVLAAEGLVRAEHLRCPGCQAHGAPDSGYLFVAGGILAPGSAADVLVCDADLACHEGRGGWVLTADGTIGWQPTEQFARLVSELREARGAFQESERGQEARQ
ncbi:MAG: FHA domain-containing protein [Planctomycetota bacterium]|jgi:pSer/pThr/pTyr-binding forkhead associated (FHA) protein